MIIFGWGKQTVKQYGLVNVTVCHHCNNTAEWPLLKISHWVTLFFIPVIPYKIQYVIQCPICRSHIELTRDEFLSYQWSDKAFTPPGVSPEEALAAAQYAGKTETQINFLKQMEAYRKEQGE